jgi:hypothetical protein
LRALAGPAPTPADEEAMDGQAHTMAMGGNTALDPSCASATNCGRRGSLAFGDGTSSCYQAPLANIDGTRYTKSVAETPPLMLRQSRR